MLENYYSAWFRYHPEMAVHVGVNGYEERLTPFSEEDIGALVSLNQKTISALDELEVDELSVSQQLDFTILYNAVNIELHQILDADWRYIKPQKYLPTEAIHQLIIRPVENLHAALKHRLQQVPEYLRASRNYLGQRPQDIPAEWVDDAIQGANAGAEYVRGLSNHPEVVKKFQNPARLQTVCEDAAQALSDYSKFLSSDIKPHAKGDFGCGESSFNRLLRDWHALEIDVHQLHRFGEKLFRETRQQLLDLCQQMGSGDDIEAQLAAIREQHPVFDNDQLMSVYRDRMKAAHEFVCQNKLVTVPPSEPLKVVKTPVFLQHEIPFAAYEEPSYKDEDQQGYYYVTPVRSEGHLLEHNWTSIDLTCVHEAYPGHHLQFVTANMNPQNSLPKMLNASATFYEGWALYCEDLMQQQGFLNKPEHQFIMLRDRLWRALRVMLDVELHTESLSFDEAAQRMCDELGFSIDQATADLNWYSQAPTVPMGYATGWALIKALRDEESKKPDFDLKTFHDRLLSVGSCALPLVIKYEFGEEVWQKIKSQVFN